VQISKGHCVEQVACVLERAVSSVHLEQLGANKLVGVKPWFDGVGVKLFSQGGGPTSVENGSIGGGTGWLLVKFGFWD